MNWLLVGVGFVGAYLLAKGAMRRNPRRLEELIRVRGDAGYSGGVLAQSDEVYSLAELAILLETTVDSVAALVKKTDIPHLKIEGVLLFPVDDVQRWLDRGLYRELKRKQSELSKTRSPWWKETVEFLLSHNVTAQEISRAAHIKVDLPRSFRVTKTGPVPKYMIGGNLVIDALPNAADRVEAITNLYPWVAKEFFMRLERMGVRDRIAAQGGASAEEGLTRLEMQYGGMPRAGKRAGVKSLSANQEALLNAALEQFGELIMQQPASIEELGHVERWRTKVHRLGITSPKAALAAMNVPLLRTFAQLHGVPRLGPRGAYIDKEQLLERIVTRVTKGA